MMPSSRVTPTLLNAAQTPSQSDSAQVTQQGSDNGAGTARRQYHSASPQLHHFLKVTPPATVNDQAQHRARNTPSATRHLRRHSSTDLDLQNAKSAFDGLAGHRDPDKDRKRAATLSLGSAQSRPTLHIPGSTLPANFTVGNSIIRESSREDEDIAEQLASGHDVRLRERDTTTMDTSNLLIRRSLYTNEESIPTTIYREPWRDVHSGKTRAQSPTARSSSSTSSSRHSDASSDKTANTEVTIPIDGPDGEETPIAPVTINGDAGASARHRRHRSWTIDADRYGTPEMPRGTAKLPHIPASILTPRIPNQSHPKHLPRAEKLPMSGYELVASSISSSATPNRLSTFLGSSSGPSHRHSSRRNSTTSHTSARSGAHEEDITIKPLYRRFEALNHRILLHLQDELSELEEQLHRLDTTDTQTRRLQNRILPASRRAEYLSGGELQWHKTDILEKIGFKLGQYNHAMSSFASTRDLPAPSISDINQYRSYLSTHQPITEVETRFLDTVDDLVTLAAADTNADADESSITSEPPLPPAVTQAYLQNLRVPDDGPIVTPIPGTMHGNSWQARHHHHHQQQHLSPSSSSSLSGDQHSTRDRPSSSSSSLLSPSPRFLRPLRAKSDRGAVSPTQSTPFLRESSQPGKVAPNVPVATTGYTMLHASTAMAVAIILPVLMFSVIPGLVGRMMVVLLVELLATGLGMQLEIIKGGIDSRRDLGYSVAVYTGVMAVVAGVIA